MTMMERIHASKIFFRNPGDHVARYVFSKQFLNFKLILDAGCGEYYGTAWLKENNYNIIGMDISITAISNGLIHEKVHLVRGDLNHLPFRTVFGSVISFEVIEHLYNENKYLNEVKRCLLSNGIFIGSTPIRKKNKYYNGKPKNPFHIKEYYIDELNELLRKYFDTVNIMGQMKPFVIFEILLSQFKKYFKINIDSYFYKIHKNISLKDEKIIWLAIKK